MTPAAAPQAPRQRTVKIADGSRPKRETPAALARREREDKLMADAARTRMEERMIGQPVSALAPMHLSPGEAKVWLVGYQAEFNRGGKMKVAALFVQSDGIYSRFGVVDMWDQSRDARTYKGNLPVIAHPPCATWGRYAHKAGGVGNDSGCFASALESVRRCGGVLEHPVTSRAWETFGLPRPGKGRDEWGGWSMVIDQGIFGHRAEKKTLLYICGADSTPPVHFRPFDPIPLEHLSKRERAATPERFASWLIQLANGYCSVPQRKVEV